MFIKPKKIWVLVLLLVVASPLLLFTGFLIKQKNIQHNMNEQLEKVSLLTINTNIADIKWIKKGKEVEIDGRLFDVKKFHITGSQIMLTGLYDEDEYQLKKEFTGLMKEKKDGTTLLNQLVLKFIFTVSYDKPNTFTIATANITDKINYSFHNETAQSQSITVTTPPPNI